MKIVRCIHPEVGSEAFWGALNDSQIDVCNGHILTGLEPTGRQVSADRITRYLPPVDPPNIFAIGANYVAHCDESDVAPPSLPLVFIKATSSVIGHEAPIILPTEHPDEVDFEAELALIIGKTAKAVKAADAAQYILGYTGAHDVSARDVQLRIDSQWARGKSFDTFCPLGPYLVTDFDPADVPVRFRLNGEELQNQPTRDMIFPIDRIIEFLSADITLLPGTVILTGTPSGVGFARDPQIFLRDGDLAEVDVGGLGILRNPVRAR